jgi:DNA-binding SARP family transcriptional activator/predicted ATPase
MGRIPLRLALLGPPRVEAGGAPLRVDTRKAIGLLVYLACGERRRGRDEVAALLWPDGDEAHARAALRRTLSALNQALAAVGADQVVADRTVLDLPGSAIDVDVHRFRRLVASRDNHGHEPEQACEACTGPLAEAVALHRGDFLAGFSLRGAPEFEDWQFAQAATLRRELASALRLLVDAYITQQRWDSALAMAERWLSLDPLHEPAHRQLMRLYSWTGQRGAAMRQYRACVRVLDQELGVAPLAETTALYQAVVDDHAGPAPPPIARVSAPTTGGPVAEPPSPGGAPAPVPLVGRAAPWAALLDTWATVQRHGSGRWIALTGEPGIGKTRLAEEFTAHVLASGGQALVCRCYEGERLAYGPFVDGLRNAVTAPGAAAGIGKLDPPWLAEAARLLPELSPLVPDAVSAATPDAPNAQGRFLEGLYRTTLALLGGAQPGLFVLDDAHWADDATIDVLSYLVHRLHRAPLLLLTAWRGEDVQRGHRLRRLVAQAQHSGTVTTLELARLDRASVTELVGRVTPARTGAADELYERSEGLPLLLVAYLGVLGGDAAQPLPALTDGIRELFQARIELVSDTAWQLLTTAAVIGRSFDVDTVRDASGRSDDEVVGGLDELVRLGLVHEMPAGGSAASYDFSHEQMRFMVYEQTGPARRRVLHRRVALALAGPFREAVREGSGARASAAERQKLSPAHRPTRAGAAQAASIARHFELGGRNAEAAEWFAHAGQRAATLYANRDALAHYQAALALAHPDPGGLHQAIGDLHVLLGDYGAALSSYEAAAAQTVGATLAAVEHKLAGLHHRVGDWAAADSHFSAASTLLDRTDDPAASARLRADWSLTAHRLGQSDRALALANDALALAQRAADTHALAQAHNIVGILASSRGDPATARDHLERSLALAASLPDPSARIAGMNNLALASRVAGDLDRALDLTRSALALCASQGDRHREAALHSNLADLLHLAGRHEESMSQLKQAAAIFAQVGGSEGHLQPEIWKLVEW